MEMYLMMLYVSLEQEEAVKDFFIKQGWAFQKPDLRVLTDHTGPLEPGIQETAELTSYEPSVAVPTFTVHPVETVIEHVTDTNTQSETVVKAKVKPKPKKRKEKSKDLGGSDKTEFQEILNEAELIAASVSQAQTVEDEETPSTIKVKDDTEDVTFTVVQNDNEDTYDDYDDYNEQVMVEVPSTSVSGIAGDSVTQSPITETPRASKRKRREKNLDSDEWTDGGEEDEARVKTPTDSLQKGPVAEKSYLVPSFHEGSGKLVYHCYVCNKIYSTKYALQRHLNSHQPGGSYKCSICHMYFKSANDFESHRQKSHAGPHLCPTCGKSYTRKSALKFHILVSHDDSYQAKYKCEVGSCNRVFHKEKSFLEHINVHAQVKPYTCEKCHKSFTLSGTLCRHKQTCVKNMKYKCTKCGKQFESSGALSNHKQSAHENMVYACACGKIFKYLPGLLTHKRVKGHV